MILEIACGILAVVAFLYYWSISTFGFWKERGVEGPKPSPMVGSLGQVIQQKQSFGQFVHSCYDLYKNVPVVGVFLRREPLLIIRDLDLIKDIMIRDFSVFPNRPIRIFEKADPLSQSLLNLEHKRWAPLRRKLSPVFTSGKLKDMFYLLLNCGDDLQIFMDKLVAKDNILEARELTARYTTDVIGTCAFGLDLQAMADEDSEFRKMGRYVFEFDWKKILRFQIQSLFPVLYDSLGTFVQDKPLTNFFINSMKDTMAYRRKNKVVKNDFLDYLMDIEDHPEKLPEIKLTDSFLASQLFIFFLAGFETSSSAMSHALYELAQHHDCQNKLREEIIETKKNNDGKFTYDAVKKMNYIDLVFKETLRKYSPISMLLRSPISNYTFSGTNITIPANCKVGIPVQGIHYDPEIYANPNEFNPENFTEEAVKSRHPMSFLSFGEGPRNCIGMRFAHQQSKVGLIKILERYRVDVCEKTDIPYRACPKGFLLTPLKGTYLKFTKI